ncbi:hypothetical protein [Nocardia arizonensis]|uniref:hypothetical protein n=1 Tax=Nocardia arizonensis TaxID=1141647 RepID=UPI0006D003B7|nr:hypothetical protein [Nocardia arizonensis]
MGYPRGGPLEILRVAVASLLAVSAGIFVVTLIPLYELLDRDGDASMIVAYAIACLGVIVSVVVAVERVLSRVRARRPVGWAPLVAVPVLAESYLAGLLAALVLVTV